MVSEVEVSRMLKWYDSLPVGQERGPLEWCITPETNNEWLSLLDDPTPWYRGGPAFGGAIAHPCSLGPQIRRTLASLVKGYPPPGQALVQEEHEYLAPVRVGRPYKLYTKLADKYLKRGRYYYATECSIVDEEGTKLALIKYTMLIPGLR